METKAIVRPNKANPQKFTDIYLMNVPVYFANVHEPVNKYESVGEKEYQLTAFVDGATREMLEDAMLNKQFFEVGKDKSKKKRKIKYKLSSQLVEGEKHHYDDVQGMHGVALTRHQLNSSGKSAFKKWCGEGGNPAAFVASSDMIASPVIVIDKDGKPVTALVGNGSVCNIKLFAYKSKEDQLVASLDTVQVIELVEYVSNGGSGGVVEDDILGSYQRNTSVKVEPHDSDTGSKSEPKHNPADDFDDDIPF